MPSTSAKQAKFMRAIAHSPSFAKKVGVKQSVGKDFEMADKKAKKFADGGTAPQYPIRIDLDKAKRDTAARDAKAAANKRTPREEAEKKAMEKAYPFNKYAAGGGVTKQMPTSNEMGSMNMRKGGKVMKCAKGGKLDAEAKRELAFMKAKKAPKSMVKAERSEEGMCAGGKTKKYAKGGPIGGIAQRGKTRCAGVHKGMK